MITLFGGVMIFFACLYMGLKLRHGLYRRNKSLKEIISSLEALEGEIGFGQNKLKKALVAADKNGMFTFAADNIEDYGVYKAIKKAVDKYRLKLCLREADTEPICNLALTLGKGDGNEELKNITYAKKLLRGQQRDAEENCHRLGKLYGVGGALIGALIVLLLI